ncbi:beta-ketoacyl synthase N-terminal-like domain-containing protein [Nocardia sp. NPDC088792]|uniref:beta-ketoacyl synthase N-terminal-like domain-containing protein n=1 Tax=Nocardia sp. NPDC088792 TaxID=3364332 RepID=UPI00381798CF
MTTAHPTAATLAVTALGIVAPGVDGPAAALRPESTAEDWFDLATALPGRGYKKVPAAGQYLLAAARAALAADDTAVTTAGPERTGVVVGTNNAGAGVLESMDRTIIDAGAEELSPARAPFMAMSLFASRLSTEHRINGFNLTTNSPATAGLDALGVAARALVTGRASVLLVGAVEAPPPQDRFTGPADRGAAVLICESSTSAAARGARVYGYCAARSAFLDPVAPDAAPALERLLCDASAVAGPDARPDVAEWGDAVVDAVLDNSPVGMAVAEWLAAHVPPGLLTVTRTVPDAGCLTPIRLLVGHLATTSRPDTAAESRSAMTVAPRRLILTASPHGNLAAVTLTGGSGSHDGN